MNRPNWAGGSVNSAGYKVKNVNVRNENYLSNLPGKQFRLMARSNLKNPTRCSGNSAKSWLIMFKVGSNTASRIAGTWGVNNG